MEHTPKNCATLDGPCGLTWDRKHNVKTIKFCPVHAAAHRMLEALESVDVYTGSDSHCLGLLRGDWGAIRAAIKAAKGDA